MSYTNEISREFFEINSNIGQGSFLWLTKNISNYKYFQNSHFFRNNHFQFWEEFFQNNGISNFIINFILFAIVKNVFLNSATNIVYRLTNSAYLKKMSSVLTIILEFPKFYRLAFYFFTFPEFFWKFLGNVAGNSTRKSFKRFLQMIFKIYLN